MIIIYDNICDIINEINRDRMIMKYQWREYWPVILLCMLWH